jgi:putative acetyltransferase
MRTAIIIRSETAADAIADVTSAAFSTLAISNHTEQFIIAALRAADALTESQRVSHWFDQWTREL